MLILSVFYPAVTIKSIILTVVALSLVMLNVILNVVEPLI
jgi:hypothetical protein